MQYCITVVICHNPPYNQGSLFNVVPFYLFVEFINSFMFCVFVSQWASIETWLQYDALFYSLVKLIFTIASPYCKFK